MTIKRFTSSVFVLALLIVGTAYLSEHGVWPQPETIDIADLTHAGHYFIEVDRPGGSIECPVTALDDWGEFWVNELVPCSLGDGWLLPERSGSLVFGTRAGVQVELADTDPKVLALHLHGSRHLPDGVQQMVRLSINGHDLGKHSVSRKWLSIRQKILPKHLLVGRNEITLEFDHAISLRQAGISKDNRAIAAKVGRLALLKLDKNSDTNTSPPTPTTVWDPHRQAFAIRRSGTLVVPLLIPPQAHDLELDIQPSQSVDLSTVKLMVTVEDLDGQHRQRAAMGGTAIRERGVIGLDLNDVAGRWVLLTSEVSLDGGQLIISPPRITSSTHKGQMDSPPAPPIDDRVLPDIVLITLDAARNDRFSSAGHHRETTPIIDQIARESLVFPNAYALAPFTLCSVATMITGLSFLDHGVVRHEDVLSDNAVTLAESLQKRGYLTAAFSATPNNSTSKGFAQGYEVFREVWNEGPAKQARRAHFMAERVVDWLDENASDPRPLHLQVHFIPPHNPYDPRPEFDLFTDPAYDGPCTGYNKTISTVDGRETPADQACIDHLLNLYDGNLREADDATGIILQTLQRRPRWKDTVVLITSDHGEAFMEHGMLAHNSTVYGEMLHVPFVLRLPANLRPRSAVTDRLVTLADIVPTLLGTAGIKKTAGGSGVDLLDPETDTRGRTVVTRTTSVRPFLGLRTLRWSLMLNAAGSGALFDLAADPGEFDNLSPTSQARYVGLGLVLHRRIALPPGLVVSADTAEITDSERNLLEALGYVRD